MKATEKQTLIDEVVKEKGIAIGDKVIILIPAPAGSHYLEPPTKKIVTILWFGWNKKRGEPGFVFEFDNGVQASTTINRIRKVF